MKTSNKHSKFLYLSHLFSSHLFSSHLFLLPIVIIGIMITTSCAPEEKTEAKSMEEIRTEEGYPVKTMTLTPTDFSKSYNYFAKLHGYKESEMGSSIGDRILKINNKIGDYVKEGDIVIEFPKDNPSMPYDQNKTAFETWEKTHERMKNLLEAGNISQQQYDDVNTQYLVAKRNYEAVKQVVFIESPIDGQIIDIYAREGDMIVSVMPGQPKPLFKVAQLDRMRATVWASEAEINQIRKGMEVIGTWNNKTYKGTVSSVALSVNSKKNAFEVEIIFPNGNRELKSGITMDLELLTYHKKDAISIPRNLIVEESGKNYVFVADGDKAIKKLVVIGTKNGSHVEIAEGLNLNDVIITEGASLLENNSKINVIK